MTNVEISGHDARIVSDVLDVAAENDVPVVLVINDEGTEMEIVPRYGHRHTVSIRLVDEITTEVPEESEIMMRMRNLHHRLMEVALPLYSGDSSLPWECLVLLARTVVDDVLDTDDIQRLRGWGSSCGDLPGTVEERKMADVVTDAAENLDWRIERVTSPRVKK